LGNLLAGTILHGAETRDIIWLYLSLVW